MNVPSTFSFPDHNTPSGKVVLDASGERQGDYDVFNVQLDGSYKLVTKFINGIPQELGVTFYPGGLTTVPKDRIDPRDVADFVSWSDADGIFAVLLYLIGVCSTLATIVTLVRNKNDRNIKKGSYQITLIMLLVIFVAFTQLLIMPGKYTGAQCSLDTILIPLCFAAYYGLLFAKVLRIYRIFSTQRSGVGSKWNDSFVTSLGACLSLPVIIVVIVWNSMDAPVPSVLSSGGLKYYWTCRSATTNTQNVMTFALLSLNGVLLLANLIMAVLTRNIPSDFKETKLIGLSVYNISIVGTLSLAVLFAEAIDFRAKYRIKIIIIFYVIMFNLLSSFVYKLYSAFQDQGSKQSNMLGSKSQRSRFNSSKVAKSIDTQDVQIDVSKESTKIFIRKTSGMSAYFGQFDIKYILMSPDNTFIHLMNFELTAADHGVGHLTGKGDTWSIKSLSKFSIKPVGDVELDLVVNKNTYMIRFASKEALTQWSAILGSWSKAKGMSVQ